MFLDPSAMLVFFYFVFCIGSITVSSAYGGCFPSGPQYYLMFNQSAALMTNLLCEAMVRSDYGVNNGIVTGSGFSLVITSGEACLNYRVPNYPMSGRKESQCTYPCPGDPRTICGGPGYGSFYDEENTGVTQDYGFLQDQASVSYTSVGCFADCARTATPSTKFVFGQNRTMVYGLIEYGNSGVFPGTPYNYAGTFFSVDICARIAGGLGYRYAGLQNGNQCFASNNLTTATQLGPSTQCTDTCDAACGSVTCQGACGGACANSIYAVTTLSPTSFPTSSPTPPTTFSPTSRPSWAPSFAPSKRPTTVSPTHRPTTLSPTLRPTTASPTVLPTLSPSGFPSQSPSQSPTPVATESETVALAVGLSVAAMATMGMAWGAIYITRRRQAPQEAIRESSQRTVEMIPTAASGYNSPEEIPMAVIVRNAQAIALRKADFA